MASSSAMTTRTAKVGGSLLSRLGQLTSSRSRSSSWVFSSCEMDSSTAARLRAMASA